MNEYENLTYEQFEKDFSSICREIENLVYAEILLDFEEVKLIEENPIFQKVECEEPPKFTGFHRVIHGNLMIFEIELECFFKEITTSKDLKKSDKKILIKRYFNIIVNHFYLIFETKKGDFSSILYLLKNLNYGMYIDYDYTESIIDKKLNTILSKENKLIPFVDKNKLIPFVDKIPDTQIKKLEIENKDFNQKLTNEKISKNSKLKREQVSLLGRLMYENLFDSNIKNNQKYIAIGLSHIFGFSPNSICNGLTGQNYLDNFKSSDIEDLKNKLSSIVEILENKKQP
ncbi:hypothetical protein [Chishuiella sp.]|uniref:hypothetical protein n=1 Tax=Chishuiella sp. TaxID=1969467 RepID=UPI0028B05CE8|nr:hypothetical protein [Chishuiella sp.]